MFGFRPVYFYQYSHLFANLGPERPSRYNNTLQSGQNPTPSPLELCVKPNVGQTFTWQRESAQIYKIVPQTGGPLQGPSAELWEKGGWQRGRDRHIFSLSLLFLSFSFSLTLPLSPPSSLTSLPKTSHHGGASAASSLSPYHSFSFFSVS